MPLVPVKHHNCPTCRCTMEAIEGNYGMTHEPETKPILQQLKEAQAENEWLWNNCTIIHWPCHADYSVRYPIEHNIKTNKDSKQSILVEMDKNRSK